MINREWILCKQAKQGNRKAGFELVDMFYRPIYQYLRRLCGNRQDAEDLAQDTFVKVWSSLESYRTSFKFTTWIYTIAYRTYVDRQRKKKYISCLPDEWWREGTDNNPGHLEEEADRQMAQNLYEAVERLDEGKKLVVYLHYYQGVSLRETAKVLDIATSTVKYRLREVIKILRSEISWD